MFELQFHFWQVSEGYVMFLLQFKKKKKKYYHNINQSLKFPNSHSVCTQNN